MGKTRSRNRRRSTRDSTASAVSRPDQFSIPGDASRPDETDAERPNAPVARSLAVAPPPRRPRPEAFTAGPAKPANHGSKRLAQLMPSERRVGRTFARHRRPPTASIDRPRFQKHLGDPGVHEWPLAHHRREKLDAIRITGSSRGRSLRYNSNSWILLAGRASRGRPELAPGGVAVVHACSRVGERTRLEEPGLA